jgi:hypothetical protein
MIAEVREPRKIGRPPLDDHYSHVLPTLQAEAAPQDERDPRAVALRKSSSGTT